MQLKALAALWPQIAPPRAADAHHPAVGAPQLPKQQLPTRSLAPHPAPPLAE